MSHCNWRFMGCFLLSAGLFAFSSGFVVGEEPQSSAEVAVSSQDSANDASTSNIHWAYVPPRRPSLPNVRGTNRSDGTAIYSAIDRFVLARLEKDGLSPSPAAESAKLLRRAYLDLVGLPPSVEEVDAFLADTRPDAYLRVVDRLLSSPHYGERWATPWLDQARYADSNGYQADQYREVWPYRDWVIDAMNADLPFDQFTVEQIAGDLLPHATLDQKIATGFHRQTTCNVEAGVDPEENRVNQLIDRVNTTAAVWLGSTIECAQCHNHKYDPFSQRDYYRLFAFFNSTPMEVKHTTATTYDFYGPKMEIPDPGREKARAVLKNELTALKEELVSLTKAAEATLNAELASGDDKSQSASAAQEPNERPSKIVLAALRKEDAKRNSKQKQELSSYLEKSNPHLGELQQEINSLQSQIEALAPHTTLVMTEVEEPRATHVLRRGDFQSPLSEVEPGTPGVLHDSPNDRAKSRLDLAYWLIDEQNPLAARVTVNRWWQEIFGRGIVATSEDFGTQGEPPSHPELLDWLAMEFMESNWSMKRIHREVVTSATYRQSSRATSEAWERDPANRLLARGPRKRLPAESIRDNALAISGLLVEKMHGPPIYPPQPPGIWRHVGRNAPKYATSTDEDRFRRGAYVVWRRSAPYPSFVSFDAPDRATCVLGRPETTTPLQALTLLNDPAYVEVTRSLARRIANRAELTSTAQKIEYAFRLCVARHPKEDEIAHLVGLFEHQVKGFARDKKAAQRLAGKTKSLPPDLSAAELASWFYIANILLNLDETITKG